MSDKATADRRDDFSLKLKCILLFYSITQSELARILEIEKATVNAWTQGRTTPSRINLERLSQATAIRLSWFIDYNKTMLNCAESVLDQASKGLPPAEQDDMYSEESILAFCKFRARRDIDQIYVSKIMTKVDEFFPPARDLWDMKIEEEAEEGGHPFWPDDPQIRAIHRQIDKTLSSIPAKDLKTMVGLFVKDMVVRLVEFRAHEKRSSRSRWHA